MLSLGNISPRAYIPHNCTTPSRPLHFKSGIENSLGRRMPHKIRKLVVSGPRDSGKTSWPDYSIQPYHYFDHQRATVFSVDKTELVIIDDWSGLTMDSDRAKAHLQARWFVTAIKHEQLNCVWNNSPFYITTNSVPDLGEESENVERSISVFCTQTLPITTFGMDKWTFDNAMDCLDWGENEINKNINHVPGKEMVRE